MEGGAWDGKGQGMGPSPMEGFLEEGSAGPDEFLVRLAEEEGYAEELSRGAGACRTGEGGGLVEGKEGGGGTGSEEVGSGGGVGEGEGGGEGGGAQEGGEGEVGGRGLGEGEGDGGGGDGEGGGGGAGYGGRGEGEGDGGGGDAGDDVLRKPKKRSIVLPNDSYSWLKYVPQHTPSYSWLKHVPQHAPSNSWLKYVPQHAPLLDSPGPSRRVQEGCTRLLIFLVTPGYPWLMYAVLSSEAPDYSQS